MTRDRDKKDVVTGKVVPLLKKIEDDTALIPRMDRVLRSVLSVAKDIEENTAAAFKQERVAAGRLEKPARRTVPPVGTGSPPAPPRPPVQMAPADEMKSPDPPQVKPLGQKPERSPGKSGKLKTHPIAPAITSKPEKKPPVAQAGIEKSERKVAERPAVGPPPGKSAEALRERKEKKQADDQNKGIAKAITSALVKAGGAVSGAREFIGANKPEDGTDIVGTAAAGPLWAAVREVADAVDVSRGNRLTQAVIGRIAKFREKSKNSKAEKASTPAKSSKPAVPPGAKLDKAGRLRDARGRYISQAVPRGKKPSMAKAAIAADRADERTDAIKDTTEAVQDADKQADKRHKELVAAVSGIQGGVLGALGKILGKTGGKAVKLAKGAGKVLTKVPGAKALGKVGAKAVAGAGGLVAATGVGKLARKGAEKIGIKGLGKAGAKAVGKSAGVKTLGKVGAKAVGKSAVKKVPLLGLLAGGGFAIQRMMKGDTLGALMELGSGAASLIPGIGTAASIAIDAGLAARDLTNETDGVEPEAIPAGNLPSVENGSKDLTRSNGGGGKQGTVATDSGHAASDLAKESKDVDISKADAVGRSPSSESDSKVVKRTDGGGVKQEIKMPTTVSPVVTPAKVREIPLTMAAAHQERAPSLHAAHKPAPPTKIIVDRKNDRPASNQGKELYHIPTEFDDSLLVLMAHDRI